MDDAGAGYSSLHHVLRLRPDVIKLDVSLIRGIDTDPVRQAMADALVSFGRSAGAQLLAEGIETTAELETLTTLGVDFGQGYLLARPGPLPGPRTFAHHRRTDAAGATGATGATDREGVHRAIARACREATDLQSLTRALLVAVVQATGTDTAYLTVVTPAGQLEHRYVLNTGPIQLPEGLVVPVEDSLCLRCRELGITWTDRAHEDLPGVPLAERVGLRTYLSVPLMGQDGAWLSTLCAGSTRQQFIPALVLDQVRLCAQLITDRLEHESSRPLTRTHPVPHCREP